MSLIGRLKHLFGGEGGIDEAAAAPARSGMVEHNAFRIFPTPRPQGGQFLTCAVIEKDFDDGTRRHELIRADTHASAEAAAAFSIIKARQVIDEQGDRLFC